MNIDPKLATRLAQAWADFTHTAKPETVRNLEAKIDSAHEQAKAVFAGQQGATVMHPELTWARTLALRWTSAQQGRRWTFEQVPLSATHYAVVAIDVEGVQQPHELDYRNRRICQNHGIQNPTTQAVRSLLDPCR